MYCKKCGTELKPGTKFCIKCGSPVSMPANTDPNGGFTPPKPNGGFTPPKKKSAKGKFILAGSGVVVVCLAVAVALNFTSVMAFWAKNFGSGESYAKIVSAKAVENITKSVENSYSNGLNDIKSGKMYETTLSLSASPEMINFINGMADVDLSNFKNLSIKNTPLKSGSAIGSDMSFSLNDQHVLTANMIVSDDNMYFTFPELSQSSFSQPIYSSYGGSTDMLATMMEQYTETLPSSDDMTKMIDKYGNVITDNFFKDTEKKKTTIDVNGIEEKCIQLDINLTNDLFADTAKAFLETARDDDILLDTIVPVAEMSGVSSDELRSSYKESIDSALDELNDTEFISADTDAVITLYVNNDDEITGMDLNVDNTEMFTIKFASDGKEFGFEMNIQDYFSMNGSGTDNNGSLTGTYTVSDNGSQILSFDVSDLNLNANGDGVSSGTISMKLSEDMLYEMFGSSTASQLSSFSPAVSINFQTGKSSKLGLTLLSGNTEYVNLDMNLDLVSPGAANIPTNIVSSNEWENTIDINKLYDILKSLGMSEDDLNMLF